MRQFDVHPNPSERTRSIIPYFVVLQSHLLAASNLTVVAPPLLRQDGKSAFTHTSGPVRFADGDYIVLVNELTSIDTQHLKRAAGNLRDYEDEIRRALERVFTGF